MKSKIQISLLILGIMVAFYCIYATYMDSPYLKSRKYISELNNGNMEQLISPRWPIINLPSLPDWTLASADHEGIITYR